MKKTLALLLATTMGLTNLVPAFAAEVSDDVFAEIQESVSLEPSEVLKPTSVEMVQELDEASHMLGEGLITQAEYDAMLLDIYQINTAARASDDEYYPEVQAGYIDYEGVVYLYEEGLDNAKTAQAAISLLASFMPGAGWGLSAIGVAAAYGGKSALERAVDKAYYSGKGIAVYYQIHHSVQSYNRVSYVVE
jgi:hypothetical protein